MQQQTKPATVIKKITLSGFRAYLKNDNLQLSGIEDGGDKIYLVKGSLLPPNVNVISYNQNISFKEMVSRLKRITAAEK